MTVEQYLHTSFEVEPDYVGGELVERHVGSLPHAKAKGRMLELLGGLKGFSWRLYMSITMIMSPTRCRVADLAAFANEPLPGKQYPDEPGELVVEVVEQEDSLAELMQKLAEYHTWGVKHVWSVDPWTRKLFIYDNSGYHEMPVFELPEFGARISPAELFTQP
jgi:Uma2 family endonuclease